MSERPPLVQNSGAQQFLSATPGTNSYSAAAAPAANQPAWEKGWVNGPNACVRAPFQPRVVSSPFEVRSPLDIYAEPLPGPGERPYRNPHGGAYFTGITNSAQDARDVADTVNGNHSGLAMYDGARMGLPIPYSDIPLDVMAVQQFSQLGNNVQVEMNEAGQPQLQVNQEALSNGVMSMLPLPLPMTGLSPMQFYQSPMALGQQGADAALNNPEMRKLLGDSNQANDATRDQFIPLVGHSGGGQSSFYTAIELYQRGFRNISLTGYEMAMSPHQRQVLEQLGIPVTNMTGHNEGNPNSGATAGIIQNTINGGMPFDMSIDRGPASADGDLHGVANNDRVITALRFQQYLDANGRHGEFSQEAYQQFLQENPNGNFVFNNNRLPHHSQSPLSGTFNPNPS